MRASRDKVTRSEVVAMELLLLAAIVGIVIYAISKPKTGDLGPTARR